MKKIVLIVLASIALWSCDKYKDYQSAVIIDSGDITVDGCGYLIKLNDGSFAKPVYLNSAFQHNNMKVKAKLTLNGQKDTCGMGMSIYNLAVIEDMVRDNE
jgi:hypothetical protein